ncbi:glutathione transferase GstA [Undibacterium sp. Xuan67W]|uniref:glutathione transferase GstA n=1 Tax=Undibacterium sp. Xuan67W TaxID=3413057 RepID=UPI003BF3D19D
MKLYYSPAACSLAAHIALREAGLSVDLISVDLATHKLADGTDYYTINPKGPVPLLELGNGDFVSEVAVILQYIADQVPEKNLAPAHGTMNRLRLQETLNFIATEIHKGSGIFFNPHANDEIKTFYRQKLRNLYSIIDQQLATSGWLIGDQFSVADAYLFVMINLAKFIHLDLTELVAISAFTSRMQERPSVLAALKAEGLA